MKNRCEIEISHRELDTLSQYNVDYDEVLYRKLAHKMIQEMPLQELHKLIKFTKIDPFSRESRKDKDPIKSIQYVNTIRQLASQGSVLYCAQVDLP